MAKELDDSEYWLLPQFLTDDDDDKLFAEFKISTKKNDTKYTKNSSFGMDFQHDFGYRFGPLEPQSGLSSPVEGSAKSDHEDDYITGLTQQLAHSTLLDSALAYKNKNRGWSSLSGSPQSTLCSASCVGCGGCHGGLSRVNSNCASRLSSPPGIYKNDAAAWDLFHAAAGEVARLRMMEGAATRKPSPNPTSVLERTPSLNLGFRSDHHNHLSYQQHLKAAQCEQLRQLQKMKQQLEIGARGQGKFQLSQTQQMVLNRGKIGGMGKPNTISMAAWPPLELSQKQRQPQQQQPGSGMKALCLGNPGSKRECAGTGVFLPRTPADTRKKTACSTVLLPDKVIQVLNLNLKTEAVAALNQVQELRLPQEWSY